ncbi:MAG: hypothetical protein KGH63_02335 [Candidatus Micrarchaeota archaeon]|nr:hypothetical protein [Candidatus Micrarchaeota archaeon]
MAVFGTSGIRDLSPSIVSPALAMRVGQLVGKPGRPVVAGYDGRRTGGMLRAALMAGAAGAGSPVLDIGLCATPTLAWFCQLQAEKLEAGLPKTTSAPRAYGAMITASHNPPEYNGIKLFCDGREMPKEEENRIEAALGGAGAAGQKRAAEAMPAVSWDMAGAVTDAREQAKAAHLQLLLSKIDAGAIRLRAPKVVVDCGNSAACALAPQALAAAGCQVEVLNGTPGEPYGRALEPNEKSLGSLAEAVRKFGADIGIAHDGDADRAIILDEKGAMLGLDVQLALAVKEELHREGRTGTSVVSTVESSLALRELVEAARGKLEITPVGSLHVAARMRELGARFGGEPCGEYLFPGGAGVPDGLMTGLYFVQMFCKNGQLSGQASGIARYPVAREKIPCPNGKKEKAMAAIAKRWPYPSPSRLDGLRSDTPDGWVLVRPSGTEPFVRITAEARNGKKLEEMLARVRPVVEKACG